MKYLLLITTLLLNFSSALALDSLTATEQNTTVGAHTEDNLFILTSGTKIKFLKNPCFGLKGYHFRHFRGFGFEDGVVKKFREDGTLTYTKEKYDTLYTFLSKNQVCTAAMPNYPEFKIDYQNLQLWK